MFLFDTYSNKSKITNYFNRIIETNLSNNLNIPNSYDNINLMNLMNAHYHINIDNKIVNNIDLINKINESNNFKKLYKLDKYKTVDIDINSCILYNICIVTDNMIYNISNNLHLDNGESNNNNNNSNDNSNDINNDNNTICNDKLYINNKLKVFITPQKINNKKNNEYKINMTKNNISALCINNYENLQNSESINKNINTTYDNNLDDYNIINLNDLSNSKSNNNNNNNNNIRDHSKIIDLEFENSIKECIKRNMFISNDKWENFCKYNRLSESFIEEFVEELGGWNMISKYQELSESFISKHQNDVDWLLITKYQILSESFIWKFRNKVHWKVISKIHDLPENFIYKFKNYLKFKYIIPSFKNYSLKFQEDFIDYYVMHD